MEQRVWVNTALALAIAAAPLLGLAWSVQASAPEAPPPSVSPQVWQESARGQATEFLVILRQQANLSRAQTVRARQARLRFTYDTLRTAALESQRALRAWLDAAGVPYRPFYIVNMLWVHGDRAVVRALAARPDVSAIVADTPVRMALPASLNTAAVPAGVEWGLRAIHADALWAVGITGSGIVVAGADTGYDWQHPALVRQYRGFNGITATHDYHWHDAVHSGGGVCGPDAPAPCDDYPSSHGTHTMGTIVGDDGAGNQIGVAPGARWIGCRNMDVGVGTPARYAECFEFFLAPYPRGGDPFSQGVPALAPHVINNSWGCPPEEGCDAAAIEMLRQVVANVRAAGIVVVGAAGNDGTLGCGSIRQPIGMYDEVLTVGATDSADNLAGFSSRGPVTADGSGRLKPDLTAPGVAVRSSVKGNTYALMSGTSMASPHVAGTVALLWSAASPLVGAVEATEEVLRLSARPRLSTACDSPPGGRPNNLYGWGVVDAEAAVHMALPPSLTVTKTVVMPSLLLGPRLSYVLRVTNPTPLPVTDLVLTDRLPAGVPFAAASPGYVLHGDVVSWSLPALAPRATLVATLVVTVEHLPRGTSVVNADYAARCAELVTPVAGTPLSFTLPWQLLFPVIAVD